MKIATFRLILTYLAFAMDLSLLAHLPSIATLNLPERPGATLDWRNMRSVLPGVGFSIPTIAIQHPPEQAIQPELRKPIDTHALIRAAARKHRVPAAFVKSIVAAESNFNCGADSPTGALGLMQLMPAPTEEYGAAANVPEQNVDAGAHS